MAGRLILDLPNPSLTSTGMPDAGATLTYYVNHTTTLQAIYSAIDLLTPLANPLGCDAAGRFPEVWGNDNTYYSVKWSLTDGTVITFDDIVGNVASTSDLTPTGGLYITGQVGSANPNIVRPDASIEIKSTADNHALINQVVADQNDEAANSRYFFDSGGNPVQVLGDYSRLVGGVNTLGAWFSSRGFHLPQGDGSDRVLDQAWSNGARAFGCGGVGGAPWNTMPPNNWFDIRTGHDGMLVRGALVVGNGHAFSTNSGSGFNCEISGGMQVGTINGSGTMALSLQMFYAAGSNKMALQSYNTAGAGSLFDMLYSAASHEFSGRVTFDQVPVLPSSTPASASAAGIQGQVTWDANFIYVCVALNTWKRTPTATW